MWRELRRALRVFGTAAAAAVTGLSILSFGAGPAAVMAGGCSKASPATDMAVTQSSTSSAPGTVTYTVMAENDGPCSTTGVMLTDKLPADVTGSPTVSVNPSSGVFAVTGAAPLVVTASFAKLSAPSDANTSNPGTAVLTITVSLGTTETNIATVASALPEFDGDSTTTGNNISYGSYIIGSGSVSYPDDANGQSTTIKIANGTGGAEIEQNVQAPPCLPGVKCFGEHVLINSDDIFSGGVPVVQELTFKVPQDKTGPQSASQVVVLHEPDSGNQWLVVPNCASTSPPSPDPCVESISRLKTASGVVFFQIVVLTTQTSRWGF